MSRVKILQAEQSYTFRSYFELPYEADEILAELDHSLIKAELPLPRTDRDIKELLELKHKLKAILPLVSLSNETARRETLVSPILLEVIYVCQCQLRIEYAINVNNWLKGNLDYLLRLNQNFLVIEAKNDDLTRGLTQLAVELIALSYLEEQETFYGAVTMGNIWQFCKLDTVNRQITQDINLLIIPDDLEDLVPIIVGILEGK